MKWNFSKIILYIIVIIILFFALQYAVYGTLSTRACITYIKFVSELRDELNIVNGKNNDTFITNRGYFIQNKESLDMIYTAIKRSKVNDFTGYLLETAEYPIYAGNVSIGATYGGTNFKLMYSNYSSVIKLDLIEDDKLRVQELLEKMESRKGLN